MEALTIDGWTWTRGHRALHGTGPQGQQAKTLRPTPSTFWWVISEDTLAAGDAPRAFPEGTVTLMFRTPGAAVQHLLSMYRPPLDAPATVAYEVWRRDVATGDRTRWRDTEPGGTPLEAARTQVEALNRGEARNASAEMRPPRVEFFIVEATTTYRTYTGM